MSLAKQGVGLIHNMPIDHVKAQNVLNLITMWEDMLAIYTKVIPQCTSQVVNVKTVT